jgi:hypothetical protein
MLTWQMLGVPLTPPTVRMLQMGSTATTTDAAAVATMVGKQQWGRSQAAPLWWLPSWRHVQQQQQMRIPLLVMQTAMVGSTGGMKMTAGTLGMVMMETAAGTSSSSGSWSGGSLCWGLGLAR